MVAQVFNLRSLRPTPAPAGRLPPSTGWYQITLRKSALFPERRRRNL